MIHPWPQRGHSVTATARLLSLKCLFPSKRVQMVNLQLLDRAILLKKPHERLFDTPSLQKTKSVHDFICGHTFCPVKFFPLFICAYCDGCLWRKAVRGKSDAESLKCTRQLPHGLVIVAEVCSYVCVRVMWRLKLQMSSKECIKVAVREVE